MRLVHMPAPNRPTPAVVSEILIGHGDEFAAGRGTAGQSEHEHTVIAQEGIEFAAFDLLDVRLKILVAANGEVLAKIVQGANL
jgi:hypothetical protein